MSHASLDAREDNAPLAEINMVPFIDVMLVLLVIFLVTAPLLTHAVKVELPRASSAPQTIPPHSIQLVLGAGGELHWNGEHINPEALNRRLAEAATMQPQPELHLRADRTLAYDHVARVLSEAARLGVTRIGFVTQLAAMNDDRPVALSRVPVARPPVHQAAHSRTSPVQTPPDTFDTRALFAGRRELVLLHRGEEYRLRITQQQKLILTK